MKQICAWAMIVALTACGTGPTFDSQPRLAEAVPEPAASDPDGMLHAIVTVDYQTDDTTLEIITGPLDFKGVPWASHDVEFRIWTDGYIQDVGFYDKYRISGMDLVPTSGATLQTYRLSDRGPFGGSFQIEVPQMQEGESRISFSVPIHLSPSRDNGLSAKDTVLTVDFVYQVFWAESPLVAYCARADQLLWQNTDTFSPESFISEGAGVLSPEQIAQFEQAVEDYNDEVTSNLHWDPSDFFDLIEEICDVEYPERWQAIS